jgi:hypothetical protein
MASRGFRAPRSVQSMQMVNSGFPAKIRYGFEMVDVAQSRQSGINRKFTPNQIIRIFRKFLKI